MTLDSFALRGVEPRCRFNSCPCNASRGHYPANETLYVTTLFYWRQTISFAYVFKRRSNVSTATSTQVYYRPLMVRIWAFRRCCSSYTMAYNWLLNQSARQSRRRDRAHSPTSCPSLRTLCRYQIADKTREPKTTRASSINPKTPKIASGKISIGS